MKIIKKILKIIFSVYIGLSLFVGIALIPDMLGSDIFYNTGMLVWIIAITVVSAAIVCWVFDFWD